MIHILFLLSIPLIFFAEKIKDLGCGCSRVPSIILAGPTGPPGPTGPAGPTGATGLPGTILTDFLYAYITDTLVLGPGSDIPVDTIQAQDPTSTMAVNPDGTVQINDVGFYLVFFGVNTTAPPTSDASIVLLVDGVDQGAPFHAIQSGTVILSLSGFLSHTISLRVASGTYSLGSPVGSSTLPSAYIEPIKLSNFGLE